MTSPVPLPALDVRDFEDRTVVRLVNCDSLNEFNSESVGKQLLDLVEERAALCLILDLHGIRYATSTALGQLVGLNRAVRSSGGKLTVLNPCRAIADALSITRLNTILDVRLEEGAESTESLSA
jgi:anti-sigma B factor antagonist